MTYLIQFWYLHAPRHFFEAYLKAVDFFEANLAVKDTARNLNKPLYQDYSYSGRLVGFLIRLVRITLGLILYFLIAIAYLLGFIVWVLFPFICIASIFGSFLAQPGGSFNTLP